MDLAVPLGACSDQRLISRARCSHGWTGKDCSEIKSAKKKAKEDIVLKEMLRQCAAETVGLMEERNGTSRSAFWLNK